MNENEKKETNGRKKSAKQVDADQAFMGIIGFELHLDSDGRYGVASKDVSVEFFKVF